ncbi:MAG: class I SAM-dependent methyltransferase [Nitrososphaeraceae archaeon]
MLTVNPIDAILWTLRRNEEDVIKLYNTLSPIMQVATGASMLNFGYWLGDPNNPVDAQTNLCTLVGKLADLRTCRTLIDVGSGYGAPALQWSEEYKLRNIICVNINSQQLANGFKIASSKLENARVSDAHCLRSHITYINSSSLCLPFATGSVDRIIALESAQHFKPFDMFVAESYRILQPKGLLVIAMPVTVSLDNVLKKLFNLGILNLTWSSEHYGFEYVQSTIRRYPFEIMNVTMIGKQVFEPLGLYYTQNRKELRQKIMAYYPSYIEKILWKSLVKMMTVSKKRLIEYIVLKAQKL